MTKLFWHSPDCSPIMAFTQKGISHQIETISGKFPIEVRFAPEQTYSEEARAEVCIDVVAIYEDGTWQSFFIMFHDDT